MTSPESIDLERVAKMIDQVDPDKQVAKYRSIAGFRICIGVVLIVLGVAPALGEIAALTVAFILIQIEWLFFAQMKQRVMSMRMAHDLYSLKEARETPDS